jgi:hypothetical protein
MLAPGELTIEDVCLASSHGRDHPWRRAVQSMRRPWWVVGGRTGMCGAGAALESRGRRGTRGYIYGLVQGEAAEQAGNGRNSQTCFMQLWRAW